MPENVAYNMDCMEYMRTLPDKAEQRTKIKVSDNKKLLDVTCGARSMWFDKHHPSAIYCDKRREKYHYIWGNAGNCTLDINPDVLCDFTKLPFGE